MRLNVEVGLSPTQRNRWVAISNPGDRPRAGELDHLEILSTLLDACVERGAVAQEFAYADIRLSRRHLSSVTLVDDNLLLGNCARRGIGRLRLVHVFSW